MPPLESEFTNGREGTFKFVRLEERLVIGHRNLYHTAIAADEGLLVGLNGKKYLPEEADAGFIFLVPPKIITIMGGSETLGLPISHEARMRTIELIRNRLPDVNIIND
jgi:hypothetical protein